MDSTFEGAERLYRAVYPPSHPGMYWKKDGRISPSAFADPKGLSVERAFYRKSEEIVEKMKKDCRDVDAVVKYLPSRDNEYHSEIHSSNTVVLLNKSQRFHLAEVANKEYMEE